ncbi:MAG: methyl-accepting chemotaxis protein, partial [Desulfamplus sp.]|nr:methyl-accepting chemotaxis protein [Desulfamplus sp.]
GITILGFIITIVFVSITSMKSAEKEALDKALETSNRYSNFIDAELEVAMDTARALSQAFEGMKESGTPLDRNLMTTMLKQVFDDNPTFFGMSTCWEPNAFDGKDSEFVNKPYHDSTGRFIPYVYRSNGKIQVDPLMDYEKPGIGDWYILPRKSGQECIIEPYIYPVDGVDVLMSTMSAPIKLNGKFIGLVTVDIAMSEFTKLVTDLKIYESGYMSIISNNGIYVAHPKTERLGKPLIDTDPWAEPFLEDIKSGKGFITENYSKTVGAKVERICVPINVGRTTTPWAVMINIPKREVVADAMKMTYISILIGVGFLVAGMVVIFIITGSITSPIIKGVECARKIAAGDFTQRVDINQKDEIGMMASSLNFMASSLSSIFGNIKDDVEKLSHSSLELANISKQMAKGSKETSEKADKINSANIQLNDNRHLVAASSEQALNNLGFVAAATEEMAASIQEIAKNTDNAKNITNNAVVQAQKTSERVNELGRAAQEIGKVTEVITNISAQTNLLALNATIEAARAGEAGKGFAVVAGEIKILAQQTSTATSEIKKEIEKIQNAISTTVGEIKQIAAVNNEVNDIVSTIAVAVGEQSAATNEVAQNIAQASQGFTEVNQKVAHSAEISVHITQDISQITDNSKNIALSSSKVESSASELFKLAGELKESIKNFKI